MHPVRVELSFGVRCPVSSPFHDGFTHEKKEAKKTLPFHIHKNLQSVHDQSPDYIGLERRTETLIWNMKKLQAGGVEEPKLGGLGPSPCQLHQSQAPGWPCHVFSKGDCTDLLPFPLFICEMNEMKSQMAYLP